MIRFDPISGCLLFAFDGARTPQPISALHMDLYATPAGFSRWAMSATGRLPSKQETEEWTAFLASEVADRYRWWEWSTILRDGRLDVTVKPWPS